MKSVNLSRNYTQLTYFASPSLKAGELKTFLRKDEILELPRWQNTSKMFSVVPTTRNSSTTHRSRRTMREKWTVTWFWSCEVARLTVVVVRSRRILNSLLIHVYAKLLRISNMFQSSVALTTFWSILKKPCFSWLGWGNLSLSCLVTSPYLSLVIKDVVPVTSVKDLGVTIDSNLTFNGHISSVITNLIFCQH